MLTSNLSKSPLNNRTKNTHGVQKEIYRHSSQLTREEMASLAEMFPCTNPITPHMSDAIQRRSTFRNWPHHINATVNELADAGFMYLGTEDKLKCYYCNGGLQKWQKEEDPWFEHAKWFPNCEYLLRRKGIDYVQAVASRFPDLKRPIPKNQSANNTQSHLPLPKTSTPFSSTSISSRTSYPSLPGITVADDVASSSSLSSRPKQTNKTVKQAMESFIVTQAIAMGFDEDFVCEMVKRKLNSENEEYTTLLDLVEDLQIEEEKISSLSAEGNSANNFLIESSNSNVQRLGSLSQSFEKIPTNNVDLNSVGSETNESFPHSSKTDKDEIQNLIDEQTCKVCLDRTSNCVFQPCGHVCCCVECAGAVNKCPICRQALKTIIKFYR